MAGPEAGLKKGKRCTMVMDTMAGYRGGHWLDDEGRAERFPHVKGTVHAVS